MVAVRCFCSIENLSYDPSCFKANIAIVNYMSVAARLMSLSVARSSIGTALLT